MMIVPVHSFFGAVALVVGATNLLMPKETYRHRRLGWVYSASMYALLFTSFFIYDAFGRFGVFHVMSIFSGMTLTIALYFPLRRDRYAHWLGHHYFWISYSYVGLIMATGSHLFALLPDWSFGARAALFWGVPWVVGTALIFSQNRRIVNRAAATLAAAPERATARRTPVSRAR